MTQPNQTYPPGPLVHDPNTGGYRAAREAEEYEHRCGCRVKVIAGKWVVIEVCEGGRRQSIHVG
jgi:hypothetical protein